MASVLVIDAKSGLQAATERIVEYLEQNPKPTFCIINKLDQENIDFTASVEAIKANSGLKLVPITIPVNEGEQFSSIIDLLLNQQYNYSSASGQGQKSDVEAAKKSVVENFHNGLVESIVETNDDLLNKYLEGEKIDASSINDILKSAVLNCKVVPTFAASSGKNVGIDIIMDYINSLMPSPLEINNVKAKEAGKDTDTEIELKASANGPVLAYVFKTMADPFIGKLSIFRIFSGTVKTNSNYWLSGAKTSHKVTSLFRLQGKDQQDVSEATCGDIVAVSKIMEISNDDTISSPEKPFAMDKTAYPNQPFQEPYFRSVKVMRKR